MPLLTIRQMSAMYDEVGADEAFTSGGQHEDEDFSELDCHINNRSHDAQNEPTIPNPPDDSLETLEPWQPLTATPLDESFDSPGDFSEPLLLEVEASLMQGALDFPDTASDDAAHDAQGGMQVHDAPPPNTPDSVPSLPPPSSALTVEIPETVLVTPRSCYEPFDPGAPVMSEANALAKLASVRKRLRKPAGNFVEYNLDDFAVYCDTKVYPCEMRSLHHLDTRFELRNFYFDGILSVGGEGKIFVKRVPIVAMPIDNYGDLTKHTVRGQLWLRSELNQKRAIYYRLGQPAREYARFFNPLLWVADLAKHFVDYLTVMGASKRKVSIHLFRSSFKTWLERAHKNAPAFIGWLEEHPSDDFCTSIVANIAFLHKEAIGVLGEKSTYFHTVWSEIWNFSRYEVQPKATNPHTVVTQYMYDLFAHMPFGDQLEVVPLSKKTESLRNRLIQQRHLELPSALHDTAKSVSTAPEQRIKNIRPGDTISTKRDDEHSGTRWKREVSRGFADVDRWFARVQKVTAARDGTRIFDVIWYYRPVDTLCGLMTYPWNNELFLSDHCSCAERHKISEDEVLGVHDVDFGGTSTTRAEFFCRQTYFHAERKWTTLRAAHMHCRHTEQGKRQGRAPSPSQYRVGDTLLVHIDTAGGLAEPCELVALYREEGKRIYRFRRLPRRRDVDPEAAGARPNELVYGEALVEGRRNRIVGRCHVRFFAAGTRVPTPYDREGVGAYFFLSHGAARGHGGVGRWAPLDTAPTGLRQGWDPADAAPRLRGFDLFCGGGNFGRGLEDGGGVEMRWANDHDAKALHTYMANVARPEAVAPFLGSVDDLQRLAIEGRFGKAVPPIGAVDFVSGGSPCPGFSRLTNDRTTVQQRKNQSLVAAFGSFVDLYRPRYGLLENVPGIVHKRANRDQDVFSQLICAIVGLGYQTQFFFLDASSCGAPQRRSRVFLVFAAPGYRLPARPPMTHAHPPNTRPLGLGVLPTGEPMAEREMPKATPFPFITAAEATADLPPVYDAKPDICVPFPDHRVSLGLTRRVRTRIALIPTRPRGMNFAQAWYGAGPRRAPGAGILTPAERGLFSGTDTPAGNASGNGRVGAGRDTSNSYGRLFPQRLIETIVTTQNPGDAKNGRALHWREGRVLTIMEARRAQGLRDAEVLLGNPSTQYKLVGNSVARAPAVALGIVFREAWIESLRESGEFGDAQTDLLADVGHGQDDEGGVTNLLAATQKLSIPTDDTSSASDPPQDASSRDSSTPATTIASTTPTPSLASATAAPQKRRLSLTVEISAPKRPRRSASPRPRVSHASSTIAEPSPLGRTVLTHDANDDMVVGDV